MAEEPGGGGEAVLLGARGDGEPARAAGERAGDAGLRAGGAEAALEMAREIPGGSKRVTLAAAYNLVRMRNLMAATA